MAAEVDSTDVKEVEVKSTIPGSDLSSSSTDQRGSEDVKETAREKDLKEDHAVIPLVHNNSEVEFVKKPGEFTTEVFKIEIRNLPRYVGYKVTNALMTRWFIHVVVYSK